MSGIRTDTDKLNEAQDILKAHRGRMRELLSGLSDEMLRIDECLYCSAVPVLKKEFSQKAALAAEHISSLERHVEKLSVIAQEYEDAERRNKDESYSIDRG